MFFSLFILSFYGNYLQTIKSFKNYSQSLKMISKISIERNRFLPNLEFNELNQLKFFDQPNLAHPTHSIKVCDFTPLRLI